MYAYRLRASGGVEDFVIYRFDAARGDRDRVVAIQTRSVASSSELCSEGLAPWSGTITR